MSFFLKYAFDNEWIDERGRVVLGALSGVGLVLGGLRLARSGLQVFGQALTGTGLAILYMVVYSALNFYGLISANTAFVVMVGTTIGAAWIADRQRSQALAVIAVGGGFLTPFLVGGSENAQLTLFSYDALLVIGTLWLTIRHRWLGLNALSYVFTVITVGGWAIAHYSNDQWLRTLLFLTLFCVLFLIILRVIVGASGWTAKLAALLLSTAPLLYHAAAVVITANHPPAIHVYLILFTVAGLWLTAEPHRPWLRFLVLLGAFAPMFGTLVLPAGLSWTTAQHRHDSCGGGASFGGDHRSHRAAGTGPRNSGSDLAAPYRPGPVCTPLRGASARLSELPRRSGGSRGPRRHRVVAVAPDAGSRGVAQRGRARLHPRCAGCGSPVRRACRRHRLGGRGCSGGVDGAACAQRHVSVPVGCCCGASRSWSWPTGIH